MGEKKKRRTGAALILILLFAVSVCAKDAQAAGIGGAQRGQVKRDTTQDDIDDAKEQIDQLENQKEDAEQQVNAISDRKAGLESELGTLNGQLSDIVASINDLEVQIADKEVQIADAKDALAAAEARSAKQYDDMKLRIQYMYENSTDSMLETLLTSSSLTDFLNRADYIVQINQYDRQQLADYRELQAQIAQQRDTLNAEMDELVAMEESMREKQDSVNSLISQTRSNISQADQDLANATANVQDLEAKLAQMIEYEQQLEIQKAKEDAARLAAIREQEQEDTSGVVYVPADSDAYLLGAIIQCESEGEPYEGKLAVGSVVLNRVRSSYFPNTISGVIYQSGQFSPVASGRLAYRLEAGVNDECLRAAQEVLGGTITLNCLYFRTNNGIIQGTVIGHHVFY